MQQQQQRIRQLLITREYVEYELNRDDPHVKYCLTENMLPLTIPYESIPQDYGFFLAVPNVKMHHPYHRQPYVCFISLRTPRGACVMLYAFNLLMTSKQLHSFHKRNNNTFFRRCYNWELERIWSNQSQLNRIIPKQTTTTTSQPKLQQQSSTTTSSPSNRKSSCKSCTLS